MALSITSSSMLLRYICVVWSEVCPMPTLMTEIGILCLLAAQRKNIINSINS